MKNLIFLIQMIFLLLSSLSCSEQKHDDEEVPDGYSDYAHAIPCAYANMKGLMPYGETGFGIEPHTTKPGRTERYVLMIEYDIRLLDDFEEKKFRETTGEKEGRFMHWDVDPGGYILCNRFSGVSITSSADFNDIPAGESLSSKIMFFSWSVWPSIQAGKDLKERGGEKDLYSKYFYFNPIPRCHSYSPVNKLLDDLDEGDLFYLGADNYLISRDVCPALFMFTEIPEVKQHVFTVTYYEGDQSWSVDIPAEFL
ncbi:MAG: hypothetical protein IJP49_11645 [Bacteroidales bacterium]|nr:hypothetical protein [Bacteroidales bacterium]